MKELIEKSYRLKSLWGTFYMGIMLTYGIISFFIDRKELSINLIWEVFILAGLATLFQYFFYWEKFLPKVPVRLKVIIHYITFLISVMIINYIFSWFNIIVTISVFTGYFISVCIFFGVFSKITGERFNEKLLDYKKRKI